MKSGGLYPIYPPLHFASVNSIGGYLGLVHPKINEQEIAKPIDTTKENDRPLRPVCFAEKEFLGDPVLKSSIFFVPFLHYSSVIINGIRAIRT